MGRKKAQATEPALAQPVEQTNEPQPIPLTKEDYIKARATIKQYREAQSTRPKRPCSQKQLEALAAGRAKNKRFQKKNDSATNQAESSN